MPKEPGEPNLSNEPEENETDGQKGQRARNLLIAFAAVLEDIEQNRRVDLDRASGTHRIVVPTESGEYEAAQASEREALDATLGQLREYLDYLDPAQRHFADGLIIRAEIYIAANEANR